MKFLEFDNGAVVDCFDEPFKVASIYAPCEEQPVCDVVSCFEHVKCLLAKTTAPILSGCRSSLGRDLYCVCPVPPLPESSPLVNSVLSALFRAPKMSGRPSTTLAPQANLTVIDNALEIQKAMSAQDSNRVPGAIITTTTLATTTAESSGLGGGAIAGIVIGVLVFIALVGLGILIGMRYLKDRRKNHGEYRPQWEEEHHAKDLPHIKPPNIEGLI